MRPRRFKNLTWFQVDTRGFVRINFQQTGRLKIIVDLRSIIRLRLPMRRLITYVIAHRIVKCIIGLHINTMLFLHFFRFPHHRTFFFH